MAIALYRTNVNSPRINLTELADLKEVPEGGPFLLEGGRITETADGRAAYLLSFHYDGDGFLYFPRMDSAMINGRFVMRKRELLTIDLEKVYAEVQQITDRYLTR